MLLYDRIGGRIYMEQADFGGGYFQPEPQADGEIPAVSFTPTSFAEDLIVQLLAERKHILSDSQLTDKTRLKLLEANHRTLVIATGGSITKTENVVYALLFFSGAVVLALALLTVFVDLPSEITLTFLGTVLGGTIATIAQKIGKV